MFNIRRITTDDSEDIFHWRNNQVTRQMSHHSDLIVWEDHERWFLATLQNPNRVLLMGENKETKQKIGVVRFDVEGERALVSINLSPDMRGKGLAVAFLNEAVEFFNSHFVAVNYIDAEIKDENAASIKVFERCGFVFTGRRLNVFLYEYVI